MPPLEPAGPNAEQITFWTEVAAPKWIRFQRVLDASLEPLGRAVMDRAGIGAGERVLDVGCGCGATTLAIAKRVGAQGLAVGADISAPMLERAEAGAREAGLANVRFGNVDAQTHDWPRGEFDVVYSRFGVMFFIDATRAFANLKAALRPGGRLGFVCWQSIDKNPWLAVPMGAAAQVVAFPPPPSPEAPGPFSLADPERIRRVLGNAGFGDVGLEGVEPTLRIGAGSVDEVVEFLTDMGPTGSALREKPSLKPQVMEVVKQAIVPFVTSGGVRMASAAWLVTARA